MPEVKPKWATNKELHDAPIPSLNPGVPWVHQTPVLTLDQLEAWLGAHKCQVHELNVIQDLLAQVQAWRTQSTTRGDGHE